MQYALTIYDDQSRWSEMSEEDGRGSERGLRQADGGDAVLGRLPCR